MPVPIIPILTIVVPELLKLIANNQELIGIGQKMKAENRTEYTPAERDRVNAIVAEAQVDWAAAVADARAKLGLPPEQS